MRPGGHDHRSGCFLVQFEFTQNAFFRVCQFIRRQFGKIIQFLDVLFTKDNKHSGCQAFQNSQLLGHTQFGSLPIKLRVPGIKIFVGPLLQRRREFLIKSFQARQLLFVDIGNLLN